MFRNFPRASYYLCWILDIWIWFHNPRRMFLSSILPRPANNKEAAVLICRSSSFVRAIRTRPLDDVFLPIFLTWMIHILMIPYHMVPTVVLISRIFFFSASQQLYHRYLSRLWVLCLVDSEFAKNNVTTSPLW